MSRPLQVVIVMSRCTRRGGGFGIRFEQLAAGRWAADWAFAIDEAQAGREGYDRNEISGTFEFDAKYPGCPHCEASSIYRCGNCTRVACWDGDRTVNCPWCRQTGTIAGEIDRLTAGGDR